MCNHIHSKQSSAESLRSFPSTPFSTQWKPISKPLWRCEWELKFSKRLFLLSMAYSMLTAVHHHPHFSKQYIPFPSIYLWLSKIFTPVFFIVLWLSGLFCSCSSGLLRKVKASQTEGQKKMGGAKGLYRKSIMLFNFADIWPYKTDPGFLFTENNADLLQHYR